MFRLTKIVAPCSNDPARSVNEWLTQSLDGPGGNVIGQHWDDLSDFPRLGTREIWEFENPTGMMHPMHVHLVKFPILDKTDLNTGLPIALEPWEVKTWKDIVRMPGKSSARIIMDFEDYLGRFAQHCNILDHEDHEMMRQFQTINDPPNIVLDGVCGTGEDCVSNPAECLTLSCAFCGNGICEAGDLENFDNCPQDCAGKQKGSTSKQFSCGYDDGQVTNPIECGETPDDTRCIDASQNLFYPKAPRLEACCGDALCEGQEDEDNCAIDCAAAPPPDCVPTGATEAFCFDGLDDDCDELVDCSDSDCYGAIGLPTTCGIGECASTGDLTCSGGLETDSCTSALRVSKGRLAPQPPMTDWTTTATATPTQTRPTASRRLPAPISVIVPLVEMPGADGRRVLVLTSKNRY